MGYKVNNWFRTDLVLDYRSTVQAGRNGPSITCTTGPTLSSGQVVVSAQDTCTSHFNTEIHRWDLLANGYVDIGSWGGFTPYVGAGAGVTWVQTKQSVNWTMSNNLPYQITTDGFYFNLDRSLGQMNYQPKNGSWRWMVG